MYTGDNKYQNSNSKSMAQHEITFSIDTVKSLLCGCGGLTNCLGSMGMNSGNGFCFKMVIFLHNL